MKVTISSTISNQILTVGLQYKDHRGGIGGVIETYSKYFEKFNFISTYKPQKIKIFIVPYFFWACIQLIWMLITRPQIKMVHIHGAAKGSLLRKGIVFTISKYIFQKKVIYHSHGSELKDFYNKSTPLVKRGVKKFFENADGIICLSKQWEVFFRENFRTKKVVVLENIVEKKTSLFEDKNIDNKIRFLFLGAIGQRKGIFDLLTVIERYKNEFQNEIVLTIGGNGETEKLEKFIKEHQLESMVVYKGWVTGEDKERLLRQNDVYILPSYNEGLPLSILEAMSYNMPVISTDVGGISEIVINKKNGFLINPGDTESIRNSLKWFIENQPSVKEWGIASGQIVEPYYAENVIPKLERIYKDMLN